MITKDVVQEILSQYDKFGWKLERVILTPDARASLEISINQLFGSKSIADSDLDAAWFSRLNANGRLAWELRSLGPTPFALVDSTEQNPSESDLSELYQRVENEMRKRLIRPRGN